MRFDVCWMPCSWQDVEVDVREEESDEGYHQDTPIEGEVVRVF